MRIPILLNNEKEIDHVYYTLILKSLSVNSMSKYQNRTSDIKRLCVGIPADIDNLNCYQNKQMIHFFIKESRYK